jgi:hypothetical protein
MGFEKFLYIWVIESIAHREEEVLLFVLGPEQKVWRLELEHGLTMPVRRVLGLLVLLGLKLGKSK